MPDVSIITGFMHGKETVFGVAVKDHERRTSNDIRNTSDSEVSIFIDQKGRKGFAYCANHMTVSESKRLGRAKQNFFRQTSTRSKLHNTIPRNNRPTYDLTITMETLPPRACINYAQHHRGAQMHLANDCPKPQASSSPLSPDSTTEYGRQYIMVSSFKHSQNMLL